MDEVWARAALVAGRSQWLGSWFWFNVSGRDPLRGRSERPVSTPGSTYSPPPAAPPVLRRGRPFRPSLGEDRFHEFAWEEGSETFDRLGIDAVPAVLVVEPGGSGTIFPGQPDRALRRIDAGFDP
jgi:hypothetical protein